MSRRTNLFLGLTGLALVAGGSSYYRAANSLSVKPSGVAFDRFDSNGDVLLTVSVQVTNPSGWKFPVPVITADLFMDGNHLASGTSTDWQWINGFSTSTLYMSARVSITEVGIYVYNLFSSTVIPGSITVNGVVHLPAYSVPFNDTILQISSQNP